MSRTAYTFAGSQDIDREGDGKREWEESLFLWYFRPREQDPAGWERNYVEIQVEEP